MIDILGYAVLFLACAAGASIDTFLPYIAKLNQWKKLVEQAQNDGADAPSLEEFWTHGKKFNHAYLYICAANILFSSFMIFLIFTLTQQTGFGNPFDVIGAFWWAYGENRLLNNFLSGKITSAEQLRP